MAGVDRARGGTAGTAGGGDVGATGMLRVSMKVNGQSVAVDVPGGERLLDTIRDRLHLTGTKEGCGVGECGACTVIMNGKAVNSCLVLTAQCDGTEIITVEGLAENGEIHPLQRAFIEHGAVQCGFCTPGMLMSAKALLDAKAHPNRNDIRQAIAGNLCRCTGYEQIVQAIESAARQVSRREQDDMPSNHEKGGCEAHDEQGP